MSDVNELRKKLDEKIPRDVVKEREGGGGKKFSYLEGHYVIARMNEIFGQGNWAYITEKADCVHTGEVDGKFTVHYIARVRIEVPSLGHAIFVDYGYGDGSDRKNIGKAHELAVKEAVTDALKRAAKNLGMSMGLALYDKEQTNVDDGDEQEQPAAAKSAKREKSETKADTSVGEKSNTSSVPETPPADREMLNKMITKMSTVILAKAGQKKGEKLSALKAEMRKRYNTETKEDLDDNAAKDLYGYLRGML